MRKLKLGESLAEKRQHSIAGDMAEGWKLHRIMAAMQREGAGVRLVPPQGRQHLLGEGWQERGIVLALHHERVLPCSQSALDIRHRTYRGPVFAQLINGDVRAQAFPDVGVGHSLADYVSKIRRHMKEAARLHGGIVHQGDIADG